MRACALGLLVGLGASGCYLVHERPTSDDGATQDTGDAGDTGDAAPLDADASTVDGASARDAGPLTAFCTQVPSERATCDEFAQDCEPSQSCTFMQFVDPGNVPVVRCRPRASVERGDCGGRCGRFERCIGAECMPICCEGEPSCIGSGGIRAFIDPVGQGICVHPTPCTLVPNDCPTGYSCALTDHGATFCRSAAFPDDPLPVSDTVIGQCGNWPLWRAPESCPPGAQCLVVGPVDRLPFSGPLCAQYCRPSHALEDCGGRLFQCLRRDPVSVELLTEPLSLPEGVGVCIPRP